MVRKGGPAERLLETATRLFLREGFRAVGVDWILAEANTARASLYSTYGSKDGLILACLEAQDAGDRAAWEQAASATDDPVERALLPFDLAAESAERRWYRGCPYLNAVTEFPGEDHAVAALVRRHRAWLAGVWSRELDAAGTGSPGLLVPRLGVLYDGGLAGSKAARTAEPIVVARGTAAELLRGAG